MIALNHFWNILPCKGCCWAPWFLLLISHFPFLRKLKVTDYMSIGVHIHQHSGRGAGVLLLEINAFLTPANAPPPKKNAREGNFGVNQLIDLLIREKPSTFHSKLSWSPLFRHSSLHTERFWYLFFYSAQRATWSFSHSWEGNMVHFVL